MERDSIEDPDTDGCI